MVIVTVTTYGYCDSGEMIYGNKIILGKADTEHIHGWVYLVSL